MCRKSLDLLRNSKLQLSAHLRVHTSAAFEGLVVSSSLPTPLSFQCLPFGYKIIWAEGQTQHRRMPRQRAPWKQRAGKSKKRSCDSAQEILDPDVGTCRLHWSRWGQSIHTHCYSHLCRTCAWLAAQLDWLLFPCGCCLGFLGIQTHSFFCFDNTPHQKRKNPDEKQCQMYSHVQCWQPATATTLESCRLNVLLMGQMHARAQWERSSPHSALDLGPAKPLEWKEVLDNTFCILAFC